MKVFVTGATGFIGGALATALARDGHEVTGLARPRTGPLPVLPGVRLVMGDLGAPAGLAAAAGPLGEADVVAHLGAVRKDWALSDGALRAVNVASGSRLVAAAERARRLLFVSSVAVYGHPQGVASGITPFAPSKRYGVSKVEAEAVIREAAAGRALALRIVRPGIVYGPGDTYGMVANMARLIARRRFLLVGSGQSRVNLLFIDDLVLGLKGALMLDGESAEDFILAGSEAVPVGELAHVVAEAVGRKLPPLRVPEWMARTGARLLETTHRTLAIEREPFLTKAKVDLLTREDLYDTAKARARFGFAPRVGYREGVPILVRWLATQGELT